MTARFSILDKLADSDKPHLTSAAEAREFFYELEVHGSYQILAWRREGEDSDRIEIFVTYPKSKGPVK